MSQRSAASNDTEPLSPSVFETLANRSHDARGRGECQFRQTQDAGTTQRTYAPGEDGHIDLMSDLHEQQNGLGVNDADNETEEQGSEFSPAQTQFRVPRYPESQRFRTPATVGRKRSYRGEVLESPQLPKAPKLRSAGKTPAKGLGLSQAFAATQGDGTSPIANGLPSELRSDRPSPHIAMQGRPATSGSLSSPMLARDGLRRIGSEPYTRYISMEESQKERRRLTEQERIALGLADHDSDSDNDDFFAERCDLKGQNDRQQKEDLLKFKIGGHVPSPISRRPRSSSATDFLPKTIPSSPPSKRRPQLEESQRDAIMEVSDDEELPKPGQTQDESEAETDQEPDQKSSSREKPHRDLPRTEEDKENFDIDSVQVPNTTARPPRVNYDRELQTSPTFRDPRNIEVTSVTSSPVHGPLQNTTAEVEFAVADSQTSQGRQTAVFKKRAGGVPSSDEVREFVPQSQYAPHGSYVSDSPARTQQQPALDKRETDALRLLGQVSREAPSRTRSRPDLTSEDAENDLSTNVSSTKSAPPVLTKGTNFDSPARAGEPGPVQSASNNPSSSAPAGTIPETISSHPQESRSSNAMKNDANSALISAQSVGTNGAGVVNVKGSSSYETAPTHLQTMIVSPSGKKRKAMTSILPQQSPQDPTGEIDMDFDSFLNVDRDFERAVGSSSPIVPPGRSQKRRRVEPAAALVGEHDSSATHAVEYEKNAEFAANERLPSLLKTPRATSRKPNTRSKATDKIWEVEPSPSPQASLLSSEKSARARTSTQKPKEPATSTRKGKNIAISTQKTGKKTESDKDLVTSNVSDRASSPTNPRSSATSTMSAELPAPDLPRPENKTSNQVSSPVAEPVTDSIPGQREMSKSVKAWQSTSQKPEYTTPNQVLACFSGKVRAYYPARCLGMTADQPPRCIVQWPGYDPDIIDRHGVRRLELRAGDHVKVDAKGFPKVAHVIKGFKKEILNGKNKNGAPLTDVFGNPTLLLAPKQRKSLPVDIQSENLTEVAVADIYLDNNMWRQMEDRPYEFKGDLAAAAGQSISADRPSTPNGQLGQYREGSLPASVTSTHSIGIFSGMAFAVSYSDEARKHSLIRTIRSNGGKILKEGFQELFNAPISAPVTPTRRSKNDNAAHDGLNLVSNVTGYSFAALIADKHSRKPKYMQALALGLPCLSGKWIERCVERGLLLSWELYLLPAGECADLDGAIKSRVLPTRDPATSSLQNILESAPRLFNGQSTMLIMSRRPSPEKGNTYSFLCQALAASKVIWMEDMRSAKEFMASQGKEGRIDWIIVDNEAVGQAREMLGRKMKGEGKRKSSEVSRDNGLQKPKIVGTEYICQSLILGNLWDG
ncbi:MAG: hypothetical protein Q9227_003448 [Pyrenula ochraceoflavens]